MKPIKTLMTLAAAVLYSMTPARAAVEDPITADNVDIYITDSFLIVTADLVLDSLDLKANRQVLITPVVVTPDSELSASSTTAEGEGTVQEMAVLPSVLVNGRNMHISYERGVLRNFPALKGKDIWMELRRLNGTRQKVEYVAKVPIEPWMKDKGTRLSLRYDPCACGVGSAPEFYNAPVREVTFNPGQVTDSIFAIPEINIPEIQIHAGKARIQFEVDRTALHVVPFTCRNGQYIDNRPELQVIDDSVKYALSDPNVELVGIDLCGYASPESPYLHNVELADGRSKILAEYLADRYNLPRGSVTYSSVPENWGEFREMVLESGEINERQRQLLLDLIDAPADTPEEYDRKEQTLKTDPRYASLYKNLILPEWFPRLRATTFVLKTQLRNMDDDQLARAFQTSRSKMSLQELCRAASRYPADTDEFNEIVKFALAKYPNDRTAIINAAIGDMAAGDFESARKLLKDIDQTPDVYSMRAMMSEAERDYVGAANLYDLAGDTEKADEMRRKAERLKELLDAKD